MRAIPAWWTILGGRSVRAAVSARRRKGSRPRLREGRRLKYRVAVRGVGSVRSAALHGGPPYAGQYEETSAVPPRSLATARSLGVDPLAKVTDRIFYGVIPSQLEVL